MKKCHDTLQKDPLATLLFKIYWSNKVKYMKSYELADQVNFVGSAANNEEYLKNVPL